MSDYLATISLADTKPQMGSLAALQSALEAREPSTEIGVISHENVVAVHGRGIESAPS